MPLTVMWTMQKCWIMSPLQMGILEEGLNAKGDQSEKVATLLVRWLKSGPENKKYQVLFVALLSICCVTFRKTVH